MSMSLLEDLTALLTERTPCHPAPLNATALASNGLIQPAAAGFPRPGAPGMQTGLSLGLRHPVRLEKEQAGIC